METLSIPAVASAPYGHACSNCSKSKTRCVARATGACERCHRLRKECTPSAIVRRRNKKKSATSRRSELEEKLDGLVSNFRNHPSRSFGCSETRKIAPLDVKTHKRSRFLPRSVEADIENCKFSLLQSQSAAQKGPETRKDDREVSSPSSSARRSDIDISVPGLSGQAIVNNHAALNSLDPYILTPASTSSARSTSAPHLEDLSPEKADCLLERFRSLHLKFFPFFYIPPEMTAMELQTKRPFLWLNIRAVCTRSVLEQTNLGHRIRETLAREVLVDCERSIDLLLGLICYIGWSTYFSRGKPYICAMANLAMSIAFDLRLERKGYEDHAGTNPAMNCFRPISCPRPLPAAKVYNNEDRRALLGCFVITTTICAFMRLEISQWKPHLDDALKNLSEDRESPDDEILVAIVRILQVADDATRLAWRPVDAEHTTPIILHIRGLQASLDEVKNNHLSPELLRNELVSSYLHSAEVIIFELATFQPTSSHKIYDFKRREYLFACLNATKASLDSYLAVEPESYPGVPFLIMIKFSHSTQVLYRLSLLEDPGWDRSIVRQTADIMEYLQRTIKRMQAVFDLGYYDFSGTEGNIFERASSGLKAAMSIWGSTLDQIGAVASTANPATGVIAEDPLDPLLAEVIDDAWLTDIFASWEG